MYNIAIVEDEYESAENLIKCLNTYSEEFGVLFNLTCYKNGYDFLEAYTPKFDIVFMDVDMPHISGLKTSRELRKIDSTVVLVFVTFLSKYAIKGYEVNAVDYIIKPLNYNFFKIKMERIMAHCAEHEKAEIMLPFSEGIFRIKLNDLNYVEVDGHKIIYHTANGDYQTYGSMCSIEKLLPSDSFFKCNRCYLVNLRNVTKIEGCVVVLGEEKITMSRLRKQAFIDALQKYMLSHYNGRISG